MLTTLIMIVAVLGAIMTACAYLIYVERKLAAFVQDRLGPNRVGPYGLFQPIADGLKFLFKEDVIPAHVDRFLFVLAPTIAMTTTMLAFAVVPFGSTSDDPDAIQFVIAPRIDIGVLYIFAVSSLAVYAVILGGWASNNKYSLLGSLRSSAQVISYEIPLGMSVLGVVLLAGSLNLEEIIAAQAEGVLYWNLWTQPLAALIFLTAAMAESNRLPFDLPECEQELVGGYHTEYSALKFGMFFLGEYTHVITVSFLFSILFLGGWHFPWVATKDGASLAAVVAKLVVLAGKASCLILFIMLLRWTLPRFRYDQLMGVAWVALIPLALFNLLAAMLVKHFGWPTFLLLPVSVGLFVGAAMVSATAAKRRLVAAAALPAGKGA
jgi:NADH-quinone oxidoreductase subunit H